MTERNQSEGWSKARHKLLKSAVGASSYLFSTSTALTTPQATLIQDTSKVMKSTQTPTSKTGTPQPALKSNETSDCCAGLVQSQSLVTILIWLLVCCFSCLVLSGTVIAWLTLRMSKMQTSSRQIPMDNRAEIPDDPVYDDVAPENSEPGIPENNPVEPLYSEVDPDYASARNPPPEPYEVPLHLMGKAKAGKSSEPVYDDVGPTEPDNIYDDVGPGPSSGPSRNKKSGRKPAESVQYLKVLP
ncbi:uncharacterized protein LOC135937635 [Cloeon dipterum]|uniref:uncharacterized protein LOC135937635 n=1 Tax=Cloeon dipterum TaxID=197152 RepID=UPI0032205176